MHSIRLTMFILCLAATMIQAHVAEDQEETATERANKLLVTKAHSPNFSKNLEAAKEVGEELEGGKPIEGLAEDPAYNILKEFAAQLPLFQALKTGENLECNESQLESVASLRKKIILNHNKEPFIVKLSEKLRLCSFVSFLSNKLFDKCNSRYVLGIHDRAPEDVLDSLDAFLEFIDENDRKRSVGSVLAGKHLINLRSPVKWVSLNQAGDRSSKQPSLSTGDQQAKEKLRREVKELSNTMINNACDKVDKDEQLSRLFRLSLLSSKGLNPNPWEGDSARFHQENPEFSREQRLFLKKVAAYKICQDARSIDIDSVLA